MKKKEVFVVIPTIRDLDFLKSWKDQFKQAIGIIVEDHPKKEIETPKEHFKKVYHYCWQDIDSQLGKRGWIISRKNSGIRCFGFLKAYQLGADVIITIDDDCYSVKRDFVKAHLENLSLRAPDKWFPTFPHPKYNFTRGFPYKIRNKYPVVLSHGLWSGALDLDAETEKKLKKRVNLPPYNLPLRQFVPQGYYFPMCTMNLGFKREIIPLMYFPLMGEDNKGRKWGYDRFDDIWAGIIVKKVLDHLKKAVVTGSPFVAHQKKSDIKISLIKEKAGLKMNEEFWQLVEKVELRSKTIKSCYQELAEKIKFPQTKYFDNLKKAMKLWLEMF